MQTLNNKTVGSTLTAAEWNEVPSELQNIITAAGQVLSSGDLRQVEKGIAAYVGAGNHCNVAGTDDDIILSIANSLQTPVVIFPGYVVQWFVPEFGGNTGAMTLDFATLGPLNLRDARGSTLDGGELTGGTLASAIYNGADWNFFQVPYFKSGVGGDVIGDVYDGRTLVFDQGSGMNLDSTAVVGGDLTIDIAMENDNDLFSGAEITWGGFADQTDFTLAVVEFLSVTLLGNNPNAFRNISLLVQQFATDRVVGNNSNADTLTWAAGTVPSIFRANSYVPTFLLQVVNDSQVLPGKATINSDGSVTFFWFDQTQGTHGEFRSDGWTSSAGLDKGIMVQTADYGVFPAAA